MHGWAFDTNNHVMQWGSRLFARCEESADYEAALVDAGFLTPVLAKHRKVFGEPGKLPVARLRL